MLCTNYNKEVVMRQRNRVGTTPPLNAEHIC